MTWTVISDRVRWGAGTVLGSGDLAGCNIEALVQGGHLAPVQQVGTPADPVPDSPSRKSKMKPVDPVTVDDSAEEPEEQE